MRAAGRTQWQQRALACGFALSATLQLQLLPRSIERLAPPLQLRLGCPA